MTPIDFKVPPVIKTVLFDGTAQQAFDRFTLGIGTWWPLSTHSVGRQAHAPSLAFDLLERGGRLVEHWRTGETHVWGSIVDVHRPDHIAFTWHVGREPDNAQLIDVRFEPNHDGTTRVTLTHSGWERLGEQASVARENYDQGWNGVLELFSKPDTAK